MKKTCFIVIAVLLTIQSYSQTLSGRTTTKEPRYSENSKMKVFYEDSLKAHLANNKPAIFINGKFIINESALRTINKEKIKTFEIEKGNFELNGIEYHGKILIKTESGYDPKFITLKAFSEKYLKLNTNPVIFQIDETMINESYDDYLVDEKYILKTVIQKIKTSDKTTEINHIKLITRTAENIKKANQIIIRGTDF